MFVCPSVTHTYCIETAKHIITHCTFTTCMIDHHSSFSVSNVMAIFGRWSSPRNGVECNWVVPRWAVNVTEVIYYTHGQVEDKKPNDFCCIICVTHWTMSFDIDRTSKFFELIFAVFLPAFSFSCTTWHRLHKFRQNCACVRSLHPIKPEYSLCG